jgi:ankyrin repeat protein
MWGPPFPTREIIIEGRGFTVRENLWQFLCHFLDSEHSSGSSLNFEESFDSFWDSEHSSGSSLNFEESFDSFWGSEHSSDNHLDSLFSPNNFLTSEHSSGNGWLWIDQICIDQNTVEERNHQVGLMSMIYARANRVLVWLGPEADGSREAIEAIHSGCDATSQRAGKVQVLFERPYWSRLWIIQEVLMSRTVTVMCGNQSFGLWRLARMYVPGSDDDLEGNPDDFCPVEINDTVHSLIRETSSRVFEKQKLSFILWSFAKLQCEDPRDKVYGLLSLVQGPEAIAVDYSKTPTEVFFNTIQRIVQDETLMAFDSHVDLAKYLRDSMNLGIETSDIESYIRNGFKTTRVVKDDGHLDTMLQAARKGNTDRVKVLLSDDRTGIETRDYQNFTPIMWAIQEGHKDIVELLVNVGEANLEVKDVNGRTPLYWAADWQRREIVEILLKSGRVKVQELDDRGRSALERAAFRGASDIVRLLLDADRSGGDVRTEYLSKALVVAAMEGQKKCIQMILSTDEVDLDAKQGIIGRALRTAAGHGPEEIVAMLLEDYGADINARNANDNTALIIAAENGRADVVYLLLRKENILVSAQTRYGMTPLIAAVARRHLKIARLLLETGKADVEAKDFSGMTAIDLAREKGHEDLVQLLRAHSGMS